jgi:hypothetical protein
MAYERDDITVLYSSAGDALGLSDRTILSQAIVMKYRDGMLSDQTAAFRNGSLPYPLKDVRHPRIQPVVTNSSPE